MEPVAGRKLDQDGEDRPDLHATGKTEARFRFAGGRLHQGRTAFAFGGVVSRKRPGCVAGERYSDGKTASRCHFEDCDGDKQALPNGADDLSRAFPR